MFSNFQLEIISDTVSVYDGPTSEYPPLLLDYSGSWIPSPIQSTGGEMFVVFKSNPSGEYTGFTANYFTNNLCSCNSTLDYCSESGCICSSVGITGPNCTSRIPILPLKEGSQYTGILTEWTWVYYSYNLTSTVGELNFIGEKGSLNSNPLFSARYSFLPSEVEPTFSGETTYISIANPKLGMWYLGVYAQKIEFMNSSKYYVSVSVGCKSNCGNEGKCVDNLYCVCNESSHNNCSGNGICKNGGCECFNGYYGTSCQYSICNPSCQNGGSCTPYGTCNCEGTEFMGPSCSNLNNNTPTCIPACENGGNCIAQNSCDCPNTEYYGPSCSQFDCNPPCINSGVCVQPNKCLCSSDYTGKSCENKEKIAGEGEPLNTQQIVIGLIVALSVSTVGLSSIILAIVFIRRVNLQRQPTAGAAGLGEINS